MKRISPSFYSEAHYVQSKITNNRVVRRFSLLNSYSDHLEVNHFSITAHLSMLYSSYTTAILPMFTNQSRNGSQYIYI